MLIVGTGGLARDVITFWEVDPAKENQELFLFDNINVDKHLLYEKYPILHTYEQVRELFKTGDKKYFVCIGNPLKRKRITEQFEQLGGQLSPFVACGALMGSSLIKLNGGVVIQPAVVISKDVVIEKGVFINAGTIIGHDVVIKEYASLGPGVRVLGHAEIGELSYIGCNAVIMPGVKIGKKVRIGVGKIIDKDIPDNTKIM